MSDSHRRYCAIKAGLMRLAPHAKGRQAQHLQTLTALICGIVGSRRSRLPAIAGCAPGVAKRQSRITRYERWLKNKSITVQQYYLPYLQALLASLPQGPLVLVVDASQVGRRCMALVVSVLYGTRALPLCWLVVSGKKGHLPESLHCQAIQNARELLGEGREAIVLGDGEFDGTALLQTLEQADWEYVCRTAKNALVFEKDVRFHCEDLHVRPGDFTEIADVTFTQSRYGPVTVVAVWEREYAEPLYLVTNMVLGEEALACYRRRYGIETFFSDQKSRGFHLAHSHLSDPERLSRLLIASCLGYIWLVCLGVRVKARGLVATVHRGKRCDLSLFQIGLLWLEHCLNEELALWVAFHMPRVRAPVNV